LGTAFGFFDTSVGFASLPAPWLGSQLWQRISPQAPFFITMLISTLTIVPAWIKFKLNVDSEPSEAERGPSVAQSTAS
jgi:hypothetical protein